MIMTARRLSFPTASPYSSALPGPAHHHHFTPFNNNHGLFIDCLLLPVCGTKRLKLDLHHGGFEINWAVNRSKLNFLLFSDGE